MVFTHKIPAHDLIGSDSMISFILSAPICTKIHPDLKPERSTTVSAVNTSYNLSPLSNFQEIYWKIAVTCPIGIRQRIRCSSRHVVPIRRGKRYSDERNRAENILRYVGHDIKVKWLVQGRVAWRQTTVLSLQTSAHRDLMRPETFLYHRPQDYDPVKTSVFLLYLQSRPPQRFVESVHFTSALQLSEQS